MSWNSIICCDVVTPICHAPRERVSWNENIDITFDVVTVTLHVSVWVEMYCAGVIFPLSASHAPRERVSWNSVTKSLKPKKLCHAPRERVSWNAIGFYPASGKIVTLHVSVWVEIYFKVSSVPKDVVTLHVSVWVEITSSPAFRHSLRVTLHVSVWVEIWFDKVLYLLLNVTLHVSVWVEIRILKHDNLDPCHAPRERVSWNALARIYFPNASCHAPRERVSWNEKSGYKKGDKTVTLHVSVWVEMLIGRSLLIEQRVTLHVSVWVEILIPVP